MISPSTCDKAIQNYTQEAMEKLPPVIGGGEGEINKKIRDVIRVMLPTFKDMGGWLTAAGLEANRNAWKFDITHAKQSEFLSYSEGGHYTTHLDTFMFPTSQDCRKLTAQITLNDDFEGGRFYIELGDQRVYPPQKKGTVLVFPSFLPHGVEPVTKGHRYSAVCWLVGPWFK
jgi:PKHD-type hydroxylase